MTTLKVTVRKVDDWQIVTLEGSIVEGAEDTLTGLLNEIGSLCIIDCGGIDAINSSGIAEWLAFRASFDRKRNVVLQKVSPPLVVLMNIMPNLTDRTTIRSVLFPYDCQKCGKGYLIEVQVTPDLVPDSLVASEMVCTKCQVSLESQVDPNEYLAFLR